MEGSHDSPIAGHCTTTADGRLSLMGMVFTREGGQFAYAHELGACTDAALAREGARQIIAGIPH